MLVILAIVALLAVVVLPQLWVRHTISRHARDRNDLPGSGGEFARHLLDRFGLAHVAVEASQTGDHYDPDARAVRLSQAHRDGRSISAVAIAAHEVAHAVQHARGERLLSARQNLARIALLTDRLAGIFFIAAPVLAIVARTPMAFVAIVAAGVGLLCVRVIVSLLSLPVEIDASFGKALPILEEGRYLNPGDMPAARSVLKAAAFTYVAGALISLVNLARWVRLLR